MPLTRNVRITPAFDKRHPSPHKDYGIGAATLSMTLSGELGATDFVLSTGWHLPKVAADLRAKSNTMLLEPQPYDLGYHSPKPMYEGQEALEDDCVWTGGPCYYDGTVLGAGPVFQALLEGGDEAVWELLKERYVDMFGEAR